MAKHMAKYEFTQFFRKAAADAIVKAELMVLSRAKRRAQVWIHKSTGALLITEYKESTSDIVDWMDTEKEYVQLWNVQEPRSVLEIQALAQRNFNSPFGGDRWIEWYLTECFEGKISWTAKESMDDVVTC